MVRGLLRALRSPWAWAVAAVLVLALGLRLWGIDFGLPERTQVDEPAYVVSSLQLASGDVHISYPMFSPNIHQVILAAGYGGLFAAGKLAGAYRSAAEFGQSYRLDPTPFYLLARVTSAVLSTGTVLATYLVGRRLMGRWGGLAAALLLAVAFVDVRAAHLAEPYALIGLLVACSVLAGLRYSESGRPPHLLLCAALAGAAMALRFSVAPVLAAPLLLACLGPQPPAPARFRLRRALGRLGLAAAGAALGFAVAYPGIVVNGRSFLSALRTYAGLAGGEQGFQGAVLNSGSGWGFYTRLFASTLGLPMLLAAAAGAIHVILRRRPLWLPVVLFPLLYGSLIGMSRMAFARYSVPLLPFAALVAACALVQAAALARRATAAQRGTLLLAGCAALAAWPARNVVLYDRLLTRQDTTVLARNWVEEEIPAGSKIAQQWFTPHLGTAGDPEAGARRLYDVTVLDPFSADERLWSLDHYRQSGYQYLIASSFIAELRRSDAGEEAARQQFYAELERHAALLAEFNPYRGGAAPAIFFEETWVPVVYLEQRERPGPILRVHGLEGQTR